jgi:hypothetical protein
MAFEGVGQVVVSLLISVLMLGHKAGTVNAIVNSVNRRKEIDEVLEQLEHSKSLSELSDAVVKHARRLTLRNGDDDIVQVVDQLGRARCIRCGRVRAGGSVRLATFWATMTGSSCAKEEYCSQHKPDRCTATATSGRAVTHR